MHGHNIEKGYRGKLSAKLEKGENNRNLARCEGGPGREKETTSAGNGLRCPQWKSVSSYCGVPKVVSQKLAKPDNVRSSRPGELKSARRGDGDNVLKKRERKKAQRNHLGTVGNSSNK